MEEYNTNMKTIIYPTQLTYYIAYSDNLSVKIAGEITPEQTLQTGQDNLYQTTDIEEFKLKLTEFNICYFPEEEE